MPGPEVPDCIDIRDAVYLRMAPPEIRDEVKCRGSVTGELEARIFSRMFPAIREEALFWYQAGCGRGLVLCHVPSILYVPQRILGRFFPSIGRGISKVERAVMSYDPQRDAVIAVVRGEFQGIAIIGPSALHDPLVRLVQ